MIDYKTIFSIMKMYFNGFNHSVLFRSRSTIALSDPKNAELSDFYVKIISIRDGPRLAAFIIFASAFGSFFFGFMLKKCQRPK